MPKNSNSNTKKIVLLDAHAIIHRAYHALPDFTSGNGEPTGALYGLSAMLLKLVQDLKPDYLIACYDLPGPTFRHDAYKEYKGTRKETDDALKEQLERSRDVMHAFGIPIYDKKGFEADDVIGTLAEQFKKKKDVEVVIASGDMDTLQLVDGEEVRVYTLRKGIQDTIMYDEKAVVERFGFGSDYLPDYKGLRGDPSDNIIGVKGIGEKTATTLIVEFGSLEDIYSVLKKNPDRLKEKGIKDRIINLLTEQEEEAFFSKELATINKDVPIKGELAAMTWKESVDPEKLLALFTELSFRSLSERVKTLFDVEEEEVEQEYVDESSQEFKEAAVGLWLLDSEITNPGKDDILRYAKTDSFETAYEKIMEDLVKEDLGHVFNTIEKPLIPIIKEMQRYGIKVDVDYLKKLSKEYHKELAKIEKRIYKHAGEEFNINSPRQLGGIIFDKLELTAKNLKKTGTGQRSTRESELEKLRGEHPIIEDIFAYRELQKLLSTYIDTIPHAVAADGRLHAEFLQAGAATGRMASQNPNLQNIPIKSELGRRIRNAFVAPEGSSIVAFDFSQIELRLAAFLAKDERLISTFKEGGDVHTTTASAIFDVPADMVDAEMRRQAKVVNFGILYGMGVNALRANLGTDRATAQKFLTEYFKNFSGVTEYIERIKRETARTKYTTTFFGRKRHLPGIGSPIPYIRASAERMAVNAPIQGTQADIVKLAMISIDEYLSKNKLLDDVHLLLQIHDELVFEIVDDTLDQVIPEIKKRMESVISKDELDGMPLIVDISKGANWGELERL